jgi:DnaK suppressor protein
MTKKELKKFKLLIIEKRQLLLKNLSHQLETVGDWKNSFTANPVDKTAAEGALNTLFAVGEDKTAELKLIDEALKKIKEGTFGDCELCGQGISIKRLEAVPFAKLCVKCQKNEEKRQQMQRQSTWQFNEIEEDTVDWNQEV